MASWQRSALSLVPAADLSEGWYSLTLKRLLIVGRHAAQVLLLNAHHNNQQDDGRVVVLIRWQLSTGSI